MLLDPVNSVTSIAFYRRIAQQKVSRCFLYLCYLSVLFTLASALAMKFRVVPHIDETFEWLAETVPPITFADGKISTPARGPVLIRHPKVAEVAVIIDTERTEPVTPRVMEEENVIAFLTADTFYIKTQPGKIETHDLSTAESTKPVTIDADFFRSTARIIPWILYPMALVITFPLFIAWKAVSSLIYSVVALMLNAMTNGGLEYPQLFCLSVYAQTTVILLQTIFLFTNPLPFFPLIALLVTGTYLFLAIKTVRDSAPQAGSPPPVQP